MFYFYVLQSLKDSTTYIGFTEDLKRRVKEHNEGRTKSIKHKLPCKLVYYEAYLNKKQDLFKRIFDMASSSNG